MGQISLVGWLKRLEMFYLLAVKKCENNNSESIGHTLLQLFSLPEECFYAEWADSAATMFMLTAFKNMTKFDSIWCTRLPLITEAHTSARTG